MAEGLPQAAAPEGPVHWPFGALEIEEVDEGEEAKEADEDKEDKRTPEE